MTPEVTEDTQANEQVDQVTDTAESVSSDEQQPQGEQQTQPDIGEQLAALTQEVQALRQPQERERDLYQELSGYDDQPDQYFEQEQGQGQEPPDPFEEMVRERVAEATHPILMGIETDRRRQRLESIADEHPELRTQEMQDAIADRLAPLAERYGNEMILTDPDLVEQHLLALKASKASDAEVPAEQAANRDAGLERGAAASAPESGLSPEDAIKQGILKAGGGGSAFV